MTRAARGGRARSLDLGPAMLARVETAKGSTPREAGAWMLVGGAARRSGPSAAGSSNTWRSTRRGRCWRAARSRQALDVPLGPEIGQCCGGRTRLTVVRAEGRRWSGCCARGGRGERRGAAGGLRLRRRPRRAGAGGGLALLPVRPVLVDGRDEELAMAPAGVERVLTPLPEEVVRRGAGGVGLRGDDARPCARLPDGARGAGAGRRGLCRDDRVADQAGVVPAAGCARRGRWIRRRSSARSARRGGRTSGRR